MKKPKDLPPKDTQGESPEPRSDAPAGSPSNAKTSDGSGSPPEAARLPIVGLGASAGGLEALRQLFAHLPAESGMGFVVIQHLDPDRPSMLTKVLEGTTRLQVVEATSGMRVEPNRVHVIPSGSDLTIEHGILTLVRRRKTGRLHLPIDSFFRALAEDGRGSAIGVVLSGSGADGTEGLRAIKAEGGIAIAQEPDSAQFRNMPESAIVAGVVDFRGSPEAIAAELVRLSHHPYVAAQGRPESEAQAAGRDGDKGLAAVLALVHQHAGLDFRGYKRTTILRRIERRMAVRRAGGLGDYASIIREDVAEARALAQDMLIHVTSFFRDPEAFQALTEQVFQPLAQRKADGDSIRIWVPGCSTGEEVYAITIGLLESLGGREQDLSIKVFGTDLSDKVIDTARLARYSEAAVADVSPERLSRFFERFEGGYRIAKHVRELVVFVKHDLTRDPPFARLDLISCRNVLIYFDAELQRRVIPMLHYCLAKDGYLFLGTSETITGFRDLFATVDQEHRIFVKTGESTRLLYPRPAAREAEAKMADIKPPELRKPAREAQRQAEHLLLARYAPPGVIVNDQLEIIHYLGRTGAYFEPAPGQPQANVLRMAREDLAPHLHEALERAKTQSSTVRKEGLRVREGAETRVVDLEVIPLAPLSDSPERYHLVVFEEPEARAAKFDPRRVRLVADEQPTDSAAEAERLKSELAATKDYLQSIASEHQSNSEDLAAANEELLASNEELQSTNEELQSAKEELQSTNEELGTVNDQLKSRNQELDEVANDLVNVLASVEIPVIIVDLQLRVRRFTPTVRNVARFIPEDVGRPIDDLKLKMQVDDLPGRIKSVIDDLSPKEWEVRDLEGRWFRMQIRPYRTADNRLDGAVLSFVDVDALKHSVEEANGARDYARSIVETVTSALVVLDSELRVVSANDAFRQMFSLSTEEAESHSLFDLAAGLFRASSIRQALRDAVAKHTRFNALELTATMPHADRRVLSLTGRSILWGGGAPMVLLAIDDVTGLRSLEAERAQLLASEKEARVEAERANRAKDLFLATLSHELRTPLSTILMSAQLLRRMASEDRKIERVSESIERSANAQARLVDDLLDVSRIVSGKLHLDLGPVDFGTLVQDAVELARPSARAKALELELAIEGEIGVLYGDAARLHQVVNNLLTNALKFTPHGGRVSVRLERIDGRALLSVTDTGIGIRPEILPQLFSRFVQADSVMTRTHGGLGLGLSIVRHLVEVHGGQVHAESPGEGKGSTFRVTLPLGLAEGAKKPTAPTTTVREIKGVRVLLVEDDDDTRETYAAMLGELGAEVRAVPSAAAGLAALETYLPNVILSDIAMPGEDGFSFIQKVRRLTPEHGGRVPAAALTALAGDEDRERAVQSGFQLHVAKPVDAARLATIVSVLNDWRPSESSPGQPG
ncbi:chemotaxis protein CheB [Anaeromyxobacter oryzisoli]|uniref:chemotaxis protein CheB n=1 Tax=Anaeromyxobacter oryzisoli TaxID=2925408 RepID=UPI001F59243A|nr:chemotaxis protein CheB [Anaeromyxobacter sp. SG63]